MAGGDHLHRVGAAAAAPGQRERGVAVCGRAGAGRGGVAGAIAGLDPHAAAVGVLLAAVAGLELAVGGLIALTAAAWRRLPIFTSVLAGVGRTRADRVVLHRVRRENALPGHRRAVSGLGTALVIGAGCGRPNGGAARLLAVPLMRSIGRLSYSWYLWHWPVLLLAPPLLGHSLGLAERLAAAAVSLTLAMVTLGLIENPGRFAPALPRSAAHSLALGAAATSGAVCVALLLLLLRPAPVGHGAAAAAVTITAPTPAAAPLDRYDAAVQQVQAAVAASAGVQAVPSNLSPAVGDAAADKPAVFVNGCVRSWRDVGQADCATGDPASATTVALVGDSHAAMWNPSFEQHGDAGSDVAPVASTPGCLRDGS